MKINGMDLGPVFSQRMCTEVAPGLDSQAVCI